MVLAGVAVVAALVAVSGGASAAEEPFATPKPPKPKPPKPEPGTGGTPKPTLAEVVGRVVAAAATQDPAAMRAEAAKLRAEGWPEQAADLEELARRTEASRKPAPAPSPLPGIIPPSSPVPVKPAPAPLATYALGSRVLKKGSRGTDVREWQTMLRGFGYKLAADGIFGDDTTRDTKAFQKSRGLTADGDVGPKTLAAARAPATPAPVATKPPIVTSPSPLPGIIPPSSPLPAPPPAPPAERTLRRGDTGADVSAWQARLAARGWLLAVDGNFGGDTEAATRELQTDFALTVDGIVGPNTRAAEGSGRGAILGQRTLKRGSRGAGVKAWQEVLARSNLLVAPAGITGDFAAQTEAATKSWQSSRGLTADGIVGPETARVANGGAAPALPSVVAVPTTMIAIDPDKWRTLRAGMEGDDVGEWQQVLSRDGYPVAIDRRFGPDTDVKTRVWQAARGLTADGIVGPASRAKIEARAPSRVSGDVVSGDFRPLRAVSPLPGGLRRVDVSGRELAGIPPIDPGVPTEEVAAVRALASRVAYNLFFAEAGAEDRELVAEFQRARGLNPTGAYGASTAVELISFGIVPPNPRVWPSKGAGEARRRYRATLLAESRRDPQRVEEWRSAARNVER